METRTYCNGRLPSWHVREEKVGNDIIVTIIQETWSYSMSRGHWSLEAIEGEFEYVGKKVECDPVDARICKRKIKVLGPVTIKAVYYHDSVAGKVRVRETWYRDPVTGCWHVTEEPVG